MKNPSNIVITGASSGIGKALALYYAKNNVTLYLSGRNPKRLNKIADQARAAGATVEITTIPVTDQKAFKIILEQWDKQTPIDLVIANAGVSSGSSFGAEMVDILNTNLNGIVNTVSPIIPLMQKRKRGQIALMSSMAGFRGLPNAPAYSTSKVAIKAYGDALRPLLKKEKISVNVIFPGFIKTPLTDQNNFSMPFLMTAEKSARIIAKGLSNNKSYIAFPFIMYMVTRIVAGLPRGIGDFILNKAPKK